jgi:hypothetical protein
MSLSKNVFVALASVAWAAGDIGKDEAKGLIYAAEACGLRGDDLAAVEAATKSKSELGDVSALQLTPSERIFTYAIATWLARVDGVVMPEEKEVLVRLGRALGLADGDRTRASAAAFHAAQKNEGERVSRYDLAALTVELEDALSKS